MRSRLQPSAVDLEHVARLIRDLGSDSFAVRDKAAKELKALGDRVEPQQKTP